MIQIELLQNIHRIDAKQWNHLLSNDYPFLKHEFLAALEQSECVHPDTGWYPMHMVLRATDDEPAEDSPASGIIVGVMPLYIKTHSYGEYVFDWSWAEAYEHYQMEYYPKLLNAIPFTPATGPRFATALDDGEFLSLVSQAIPSLCKKVGASSWHSLFTDEAWREEQSDEQSQEQREEAGDVAPQQPKFFATRTDCQYHWFNKGFTSFGDFLDTCTSRKRKNIKKERAKIGQQGVTHETFSGETLTPERMETFYPFYQRTYLVRGRQGYLNQAFFQQLAETMAHSMVLMLAKDNDEYVAGALYFKDSNTLYGRYWGCNAHYDALHFETCYYQGIDYCIRHNLSKFDPGAQGEHKIARGFEPTFTHSKHWMMEQGMHQAIDNFVNEEASLIKANAIELAKGLPFKAETD